MEQVGILYINKKMTQVPVDFVSLFTVIKTPVNVSEVQAGLDEVAANIPGWTDRRSV